MAKTPKRTPKRTPGVTYFDLDSVAQEPVIILIGGKEYPLQVVTVADYIANTKAQAEMAVVPESDLEGQIGLLKTMLLRAFPTMSVEVFDSMTMPQLNKLVEMAHDMNGQKSAKNAHAAEAEAAAVGNPTAG